LVVVPADCSDQEATPAVTLRVDDPESAAVGRLCERATATNGRSTMKPTLCGACLLLVAYAAGAADENGQYATLAATNESTCGTFLSARDEAHRGQFARQNMYKSWLMGFVTGYDFGAPDTYDIAPAMDLDAMMLWVENYCRRNPLASFAQSAGALATQLAPDRQTHKPPPQ